MKLTFSFTDSPDLESVPSEDIYNSLFEIPDETQYLIGYEARILAVATAVGQLSDAMLHLSCSELGIKNHSIKTTANQSQRSLSHELKIAVLQFERSDGYRIQSRQLKIYLPISPVVPNAYLVPRGKSKRQRDSLTRNLLQVGSQWCKTEEQHAFAATVSGLVDQVLMLLNAEPAPSGSGWSCRGFHPWWTDNTLIDRHNQRRKKREAEERKRQKQEERRRARGIRPSENGTQPSDIPITGAGRRYGARPGKFMGVQMRSQLEIRFAAELQERNIRWVYEGEVLGEGGYLVDFYLPSLASWVEVKGQFEPRDNFLLKEVAEYLKRERQQRLFVYTQTKAFVVNSSGFREISHGAFWSMLLK
jgi:hypothetical protein